MMTEEKIRKAAVNYICDDTEYYIGLFMAGAKWAQAETITDATKWLTEQFNMPNDFEYHFRKALTDK